MVSSSKLVIFRIYYPSQTFSVVHFRHITHCSIMIFLSKSINLMIVLCSRSQFGLISEFVTGPIFSLKRTLETAKCSLYTSTRSAEVKSNTDEQRKTQRWIIGCLKVRSGVDEAYFFQYNIGFI